MNGFDFIFDGFDFIFDGFDFIFDGFDFIFDGFDFVFGIINLGFLQIISSRSQTSTLPSGSAVWM